MDNNYTLGRGKLYFDLFKPGTNVGSGERYIGNTPELSLSNETETLDHYNSDEGLRELDMSVLLEVASNGSFTTDNIDRENVALFFLGESTDKTSTTKVGHREAFTGYKLGRYLQVGASSTDPTGVRNITNVKVFTAAVGTVVDLGATLVGQSGVTEVEATGNYELDLEMGRIYLEPTATGIVATDKLLVQCDVTGQTRSMIVSSNSMIYGSLRFISDNPVGENRDLFYPKVTLTPDGDYNLKGDDWQTMGFTFKALKMAGRKRVYADIRGANAVSDLAAEDMRTVTVSAAASSGPAGTPISVSATVRDGNNDAVSGETVTFTTGTGATVSAATAVTNGSGVATVTVNRVAAGTAVVTAAVTLVDSTTVSGVSQTVTFS